MKIAVLVLCTLIVAGCSGAGVRSGNTSDLDDDGVVNNSDQCPATSANTPVNAVGCDLFVGSIEGLDFEPGGHNLTNSSRVAMASLVQNLKRYPEVMLELGGHTDNRGSAADNLELSKRRVMAVVKYLVVNGIEGRRLKPYGYGESRPLVSNATPEGRSTNRRIDMNMIR